MTAAKPKSETKAPKVPARRRRLSAKFIASVRARLCLGVGDFATCLGVSPATAYRWEAATWSRLRPSAAAIIIALSDKSDAELKKLGAAVAAACAQGAAFQAPRLVLDAVALPS